MSHLARTMARACDRCTLVLVPPVSVQLPTATLRYTTGTRPAGRCLHSCHCRQRAAGGRSVLWAHVPMCGAPAPGLPRQLSWSRDSFFLFFSFSNSCKRKQLCRGQMRLSLKSTLTSQGTRRSHGAQRVDESRDIRQCQCKRAGAGLQPAW